MRKIVQKTAKTGEKTHGAVCLRGVEIPTFLDVFGGFCDKK
jgi:hypothetical protein